jgi:hypothetical protein
LQLLQLRFDKAQNPPRHPPNWLLWLPLSQLWQSLPLSLWQRSHRLKGLLPFLLILCLGHQTEWTQ